MSDAPDGGLRDLLLCPQTEMLRLPFVIHRHIKFVLLFHQVCRRSMLCLHAIIGRFFIKNSHIFSCDNLAFVILRAPKLRPMLPYATLFRVSVRLPEILHTSHSCLGLN